MKKAWTIYLSILLVFMLMSPVNITLAASIEKMSVRYAVHVQTYGDSQGWVSEGLPAGTSGESKRLESIRIELTGNEYTGNVVYKTHVQSYGWLDWVKDGESSGTTGESKRLEGIEIYLTGEVAKHYDITYRVHCQGYGWLDWVSNGTMAGTNGESKRLEAIEIKLVPKVNISDMGVEYRTHCQSYGWLHWMKDGESSGTTGESKRLEAIEIKLSGNCYSGGIQYKTHVQSYGWLDWVSNGALSGTSGESKRLEAIEICLYGEIAEYYNVYYRVHVQGYGWQDWKKNGEMAGTSGESKRLEAIEIKLEEKQNIVTQYNDVTGQQAMFYTIETVTGELIIVDGGWRENAWKVREIIALHGNHVSAWILTHPHPDHIGAFNEIYAQPDGIVIDDVYTIDMNYDLYKQHAKSWDDFETYETFLKVIENGNNINYLYTGDELNVCGLDMKVYSAYDDSILQYSTDLANKGSLMFELSGEYQSMLFCSDVNGAPMLNKIMDEFGDELSSTYIQMGHHGNAPIVKGFLEMVNPKIAFFDAPEWLINGTEYTTMDNIEYVRSLGADVFTYLTAPNIIKFK